MQQFGNFNVDFGCVRSCRSNDVIENVAGDAANGRAYGVYMDMMQRGRRLLHDADVV